MSRARKIFVLSVYVYQMRLVKSFTYAGSCRSPGSMNIIPSDQNVLITNFQWSSNLRSVVERLNFGDGCGKRAEDFGAKMTSPTWLPGSSHNVCSWLEDWFWSVAGNNGLWLLSFRILIVGYSHVKDCLVHFLLPWTLAAYSNALPHCLAIGSSYHCGFCSSQRICRFLHPRHPPRLFVCGFRSHALAASESFPIVAQQEEKFLRLKIEVGGFCRRFLWRSWI